VCVCVCVQWRHELMSSFAVPNDQETNDAIIFGHQVAWLIEEFAQYRRIVAHFHEWLAGVGLILLAQKKAKYAPNPMQSDPTQCNPIQPNAIS
jgi:glycogen synthase